MTIKYREGKIYKVMDNSNGKCYVGATCEATLAKRLAQHVMSYNTFSNNWGRGYNHVYKILENGNYKIVLIENYACKSSDELAKRQDYWVENIPNNVNNDFKPNKSKHYYLVESYLRDTIIGMGMNMNK